MKRILLIMMVFVGLTAFAGVDGNGDDVKPKQNKVEVKSTAEFPNPLLKLLKFFFKDYNNDVKSKVRTPKSDTTVFRPRRYQIQ